MPRPEDARPLADSTASVHAGATRSHAHHAIAPGVAQTATYVFESSAELERYMRGDDPDPHREEYGRYGNPTVQELERRLAALEAGESALAFASGMAAVTTALLALLKGGDHVVLVSDCYRRTRQFVTTTLQRFGVTHTLAPPGDVAGIVDALRPETKVVVAETPTNPWLVCTDLEELARGIRARGRARLLVDATFATPVLQRPLLQGADLVVHSATKYLAGHNDVLGGVLVGREQLVSLVRDLRSVLGGVMDPHAAFLVARGLKTLALRVERQCRTALALAEALERHPAVARVAYPFLPSHPSHAVARRQMAGGGGVVSFVVKGGRAAAARVVDGCRMSLIAASLGGTETLVEQPAVMSFFELDDAALHALGIDPALVRVAVGIEETSDVVSDLLAALDRVVPA